MFPSLLVTVSCSGLIQSTLPQAQWDRMLYGTLQVGYFVILKTCGSVFYLILPCFTSQFLAAKDSLQPSEEKVGAFTKIIEAMGFTGPLKYNKWVTQLIW
uniref:Uncharacterized protein n=1 Tax=Gopherus agassizii TaxID=38772 RepID=A0A452IBD7_9SAUR